MKQKKLLNKISEYFDMDKRRLCKRRDKLKTLLKQLRKKEKELKERSKTENNKHKLQHLKKQRATIRAQRIKGIKALKKTAC